MKKFFSNKWFALFSGVLAIFLLLGASGIVSLNNNFDLAASKSTKAYAISQVDTVLWNREASCSAASFAAHFKDSVSITLATVRRVIDGQPMALLLGDTLTPFTTFSSTANGGSAVTAALTLAPLADQYYIIITYAGSAQGFTSPTAVYEVIKQYSRR